MRVHVIDRWLFDANFALARKRVTVTVHRQARVAVQNIVGSRIWPLLETVKAGRLADAEDQLSEEF